MQKKVIAAVIGGLLITPAAFADVNISGRLSAGIESYKLSSGPRAPYSNELRASDQSSSLIFSGSEDLGGGMKAWFKIDNRFNVPGALNSFDSSGNTQFGLSGSFGKLAIGRSDLHYNEMFRYDASRSGSLQSWVTGSVFSQVDGIVIANGTRTSNVVKWDGSFGMVSATLAYSTAPFSNEGSGAGADGSKGDGTVATVRYQGGPLSLGASLWNAKTEGTTPVTQKSQRAWGGYNLPGGISVALGYDSSSVETGGFKIKRTAYALPVKFSSGAETFYVRYAMAADVDATGLGKVSDTGAKIYSVGWDHALSKRTFVGVHYSSLDNDPGASYSFFANGLSGTTPNAPVGGIPTLAGEDAKQLYFGMAHFY